MTLKEMQEIAEGKGYAPTISRGELITRFAEETPERV